ncbi:MAG: MFS transporter [Micrococcales bacterium]|nr:MFS transporter [Micrococcales bacterium]
MPVSVWILAGISLSVALGFGIVAPVLPTFAREFGVGNFAASAVISVFAAMRLIFSPVVGRLGDRLGERTVLIVGIIIVAVSSALAGLSHSYVQLLTLRGAGGIGSAMFSVSGMSILLGSVSSELRGRASALYQGGFLLGAIAGPGLGGLVSGISLRAPFFVYAGTLVIAAIVGLFLPSPRRRTMASPTQETDVAETPLTWGELLRNADYQAACVTSFCVGWVNHGVRASLVPLLVAATMYDVPEQAARWTSIAMAVGAGVQAVAVMPAGSVVDRVGRRPPMIVATLAGAVGIAAIPLCHSIIPLTCVLAFYALSSAALGSAPAAVVGDVAGGRSTRAVAVFSMCSDFGSIVGPLAAGKIADSFGFTPAFTLAAIMWLAATAMCFRMPDAYRRPGGTGRGEWSGRGESAQ